MFSFNNTNGAFLWAGLTLGRDGNFYGTTGGGTNNNYGTVFKFAPGWQLGTWLDCSVTGNQPILSWNNPAWSLQSATNVTGAFSTVSGAASPYTNAMPPPRQFFRLTGN